MFSQFIWVTLIQKQQKKKRKGAFEFWAWAPHFIMIWNITVRYKFWRTYFSRMPNMQVLYPNCVKNHMKAMLHWQMCGCILQFELNESIIKQLIKHLFHTFFLLLFRSKSKWGCPISSKISKLYFISNIDTVTQRLKDYLKFCTTILNYPFKKQ